MKQITVLRCFLTWERALVD